MDDFCADCNNIRKAQWEFIQGAEEPINFIDSCHKIRIRTVAAGRGTSTGSRDSPRGSDGKQINWPLIERRIVVAGIGCQLVPQVPKIMNLRSSLRYSFEIIEQGGDILLVSHDANLLQQLVELPHYIQEAQMVPVGYLTAWS